MSRFIMYGGNACENCVYYRMSDRRHVWRCDEPDNQEPNKIHGVVYMLSPTKKNWRNKCEQFKEKDDNTKSNN